MSEIKNMSPKGKVVECSSCGAQFDEMLPKCPYCASMSIKGAQAEYMEKLEDVRESMEDLAAVPMQETKKEFKKQTKFVLIVVGVILGLLLCFVLVELIFGYRSEKRDRQADYAWQQENFPILNELYEQENYEEMVEIYVNAYKENKPVGAWEHYEFGAAMEMFLDIEDTWAREQAGEELTKWDYHDLLYMGFRVDNYEESSAYTTEEKERMAPYIERVRADFETRWQFSEEELEEFEKEAEKNYGYISYDVVPDYIEDWMERNGKS